MTLNMHHNFFSINTYICDSFQCSKSSLLCLITRMFKISLVSISDAILPCTGSPLNWLRTERQRKERKNGNIGEYAIVHKLACSNWILWLCHVPSKLPQQPESLLTKCINLRYVDGHHVKCAPLASTPVMAFKINRLDVWLRWEYNSMQTCKKNVVWP